MGVHYGSLFPTLTDERHKVGIGDSDLPAEPVHRQFPFLDPAAHRPGTDLQKLSRLGNGVERGERRGAGCGCRRWFLSSSLSATNSVAAWRARRRANARSVVERSDGVPDRCPFPSQGRVFETRGEAVR